MGIPAALNRQALVRLGQRLEYFTVVWNGLEALVSIVAGIIAGSVALVGFGLDIVIEMASGLALLWAAPSRPGSIPCVSVCHSVGRLAPQCRPWLVVG